MKCSNCGAQMKINHYYNEPDYVCLCGYVTIAVSGVVPIKSKYRIKRGNMKQMIICQNADEAQAVTQLLIDGGIPWGGGGNAKQYLNKPFVRTIEYHSIRYTSSVSSIYEAIQYAKENDYKIITSEQFLHEPTIIVGWKEPIRIPKLGDVICDTYSGLYYLCTSNMYGTQLTGTNKGKMTYIRRMNYVFSNNQILLSP